MTDNWQERPYGWKKILGQNSQLIRLKPRHNTSMSAAPETLGPHGLKQNNAHWEHIEYLGPVDGNSEAFELRYEFLPKDHRPDEQPGEMVFQRGARFYSVLPDHRRTGFYHNLHNDSDATIEMKVDWEDRKA